MLEVFARVEKGNTEKTNDDRALVDDIVVRNGRILKRFEKRTVLCAVCDGVGGRNYGYLGAETALESLRDELGYRSDFVSKNELIQAVFNANAKVIKKRESYGLENCMYTTLAGIYFFDNSFFVFNVGDSRVYRFRHKYLMQLTKDQSVVQQLLDDMLISEDEARTHPEKNVITHYLGHHERCLPVIESFIDDFLDEDIYLICSDGLSDFLSDDEICQTIEKHKAERTFDKCCDELVEIALQNNSTDNISVVLIGRSFL